MIKLIAGFTPEETKALNIMLAFSLLFGLGFSVLMVSLVKKAKHQNIVKGTTDMILGCLILGGLCVAGAFLVINTLVY